MRLCSGVKVGMGDPDALEFTAVLHAGKSLNDVFVANQRALWCTWDHDEESCGYGFLSIAEN